MGVTLLLSMRMTLLVSLLVPLLLLVLLLLAWWTTMGMLAAASKWTARHGLRSDGVSHLNGRSWVEVVHLPAAFGPGTNHRAREADQWNAQILHWPTVGDDAVVVTSLSIDCSWDQAETIVACVGSGRWLKVGADFVRDTPWADQNLAAVATVAVE